MRKARKLMSHEASDFDPMDPHGFHSDDKHGHVIVSMRTLLSVLTILLVLTALTVFASQLEIWISKALDIDLPQWVNVSVAMSIATVKGLLVLLFFMQLKYDSRLNAIIFAFCLLTFGIFLGFTALDLFSRDQVHRYREGEIVAGGLGGVTRVESVYNPRTGEWEQRVVTLPPQTSVAEHAATRERPSTKKPKTPAEPQVSTANRSIPLTGLLLFEGEDKSHDGQPGPGEQRDP